MAPLKAIILASTLLSVSAFTVIQPPCSSSSTSTSTSALNAMRRGRPRGPVRTIEVKPPMNEEIEFDQLRVSRPIYDPTSNAQKQKDESLGIMSKADAIAKAKELGGLDVVLINAASDPPVVKLVDYSKFRYEKEKKAKEVKKNSKASELKEVKMSYKIDVHDYGVRIKSATKFLKQGNRVKCTVQFKGREVQHDKLGFKLIERMAEDMSDICTLENKPKREGRFMSAIVNPKAEVTRAVNDAKRKADKDKKKARRDAKTAKAQGLDLDVE